MAANTHAPRRSPCPIACTLDLLGDRWTLLVIRDLMLGKTHYDQFLSSPEGIATNILAARLRWLQEQDLVRAEADPADARRRTYRLTPKGESLRPVLKALFVWGRRHIPGTLSLREARRRHTTS